MQPHAKYPLPAVASPSASAEVVLDQDGVVVRSPFNSIGLGRTITGTANKVTVTNGDGIAGNPTLTLPAIISQEGIAFPASQVASADANTLDDYEEGTWTPSIASGTGTITSSSATGAYTKIGNRVLCELTITITTNGTGATNVGATLPFTSSNNSVGCGRENSVSGKMVQGVVVASSSSMNIFNYDNTYPGASGAVIMISIQYKV